MDIKVVIGFWDMHLFEEDVAHILVEMLAGVDDDLPDGAGCAEGTAYGCRLDELGACADDGDDLHSLEFGVWSLEFRVRSSELVSRPLLPSSSVQLVRRESFQSLASSFCFFYKFKHNPDSNLRKPFYRHICFVLQFREFSLIFVEKPKHANLSHRLHGLRQELFWQAPGKEA